MRILFLFLLVILSASSQTRAQENQGSVQSDGFTLQWQRDGEGQTALIIGSSQYYPGAFSENLRDHLDMVFIDHRGFVRPPENDPAPDYSLERVVADMELIREELGLGKVIVIGHSGHAFMALAYAWQYPEHVSRIVLIGTAPDFGPGHSAWRDRAWEESVDPERKQAQMDWYERIPDSEIASLSPGEAFVRNYVRHGPHAWYDPYFDSTPLWEGVYVNGPMFDHMWGKVFAEIDIRPGLAKMKIPVFIALGRYDNLVAPPDSWEPYRSHFHDLTIRVFEKSGHSPMFEQPEDFDRELLEWLAR